MLSTAAFSLALLAGEYAVQCAGFVLAFAWGVGSTTRMQNPVERRRRWASMLPFALPTAAYLAARHVFGYGAQASGFYQDPLHDTWLFLSHAPHRLSVLILGGWFSQDAAAWKWNDQEWPGVVATVICSVWGLATVAHVVRSLTLDARKMTWTLVGGSVLALVPVLAVLPSVRLVGVPMLGIAPVVGVILDVCWFGRDAEARHGSEEWAAIAAMLLGFAHLVHGPGRAWANARHIQMYADEFADHAADLAKRLAGRTAPEVVVVRGLDDVFLLRVCARRARSP